MLKDLGKKNQKIFSFLLAAAMLAAFFFLSIKKTTPPSTQNTQPAAVAENTTPTTTLVEIKTKSEPAPLVLTDEDIYLENVPFVVQAPFGEWKDPRQQDACEEMTALLAVSWATGQTTITKVAAKEKILAIVKYQADNFGESRDTSANDTIDRIYFGYFNYQNVRVEKDITSAIIIQTLINGNLVIVPVNGQLLKNIHFTQPGPERHMIIIRGFDSVKKEFITNDVGFGTGENYHYPAELLFNAIGDYPSGYHIPREGMPKVMIVVAKEEK